MVFIGTDFLYLSNNSVNDVKDESWKIENNDESLEVNAFIYMSIPVYCFSKYEDPTFFLSIKSIFYSTS